MIYALLGNLAQPLASGGGLGVYIVGDQYQHDCTSLPEKRRVNL